MHVTVTDVELVPGQPAFQTVYRFRGKTLDGRTVEFATDHRTAGELAALALVDPDRQFAVPGWAVLSADPQGVN